MSDTAKRWLGTSMQDIYGGRGPWCFETPPINPSRRHAVLYELPATLKSPPKPHISSQVYHWDNDYVRMPYSSQNLFPVENDSGEKGIKERWNIIEAALLQPIQSSRELEAIISSYNTKLPKFLALHNFFEEILEEEETRLFFNNLLPKIISLALRLPHILPGSLPLLKQGDNRSISLSQLQIASLLANAFLCTFPWRRDSASTYPGINFVRLFAAYLRPEREQAVAEKLKCICHYFRRVTEEEPVGVVTFERKYIPKSQLPNWNYNNKNLSETRLHVTSKGYIEDDGLGLLQVDFANKNVGGGVLGFGCVQEEIRYIICPELIVSRLFTEQLGPTEALVIIGAERYSKYEGYGDSFSWDGDFKDDTPHDAWGRRRTTIVAIDALLFHKPLDQYYGSTMLRELNKAYVGFHSRLETPLPAVATGNWGCGAFRGDARLKALLQLMACGATNRDMVYYTFGDEDLEDQLFTMHSFIVSQQIKISQLWKYLLRFSHANVKPEHLYQYIQQAHFDSKTKPSIKNFFGGLNLGKYDKNRPSTSAINNNEKESKDTVIQIEDNTPEFFDSEDVIDSSQTEEMVLEPSQDIIESSQPEPSSNDIIPSINRKPNIKEQNEILHMFDVIDNNVKKRNEAPMDVENNSAFSKVTAPENATKPIQKTKNTIETVTSKRKITDYFVKIDKG